jgi:hypothetical protein
MKLWVIVIIAFAAILFCGIIKSKYSKKQSDKNIPPDDQYPLW